MSQFLFQKSFIVPVVYNPPPSMEYLHGHFQGVEVYYDFSRYKWERHESCRDISEVSGDREMCVIGFRQVVKSHRVILWGARDGLRPAIEKELIAFRVNPKTRDLFHEQPLVALGAHSKHRGSDGVAMSINQPIGRVLGLAYWGHEFDLQFRFLFVRLRTTAVMRP